MCSIDSLHIEEFKCITNSTLDFFQFSPIIGDNGSGKSTIVEAMSFVLGGPIDKKLKFGFFSVSATMKLADGIKKIFKRISRNGQETFFIDAAKISQKKYNDQWDSLNVSQQMKGIVVNGNNWEAISASTPAQFSSFMEKLILSEEIVKTVKKNKTVMKEAEQEWKKTKGISKKSKKENFQKAKKAYEEALLERNNGIQNFINQVNPRFERIFGLLNEERGVSASLELVNDSLKICMKHNNASFDLKQAGGIMQPVVSLAIILAINEFKKTPFVVIDNLAKAVQDNEKTLALHQWASNGVQIIATWGAWQLGVPQLPILRTSSLNFQN